jgi:tetratricopeptide (TPR) repeat protein
MAILDRIVQGPMSEDLEQRRLARAQELADAGMDQLARRDYAAAEESFRAALGLEPNNSALHNNLGVALREQRRDREAIAEFDLAVQANPGSTKARRNLTRAGAATAGTVGAIVFFVAVHALPELWRQLRLPEAVVDGLFFGTLVAAILVLWALGRYRRRGLSPQARAVYRQEVRREGARELGRGLFKAGPPVAVVIAMVLILAANSNASVLWFAGGAVFIVAWLFTWRRLWNGMTSSRAR